MGSDIPAELTWLTFCPSFLAQQFTIKEEIYLKGPQARSCLVAVVFDGSTRLGEALAVILRYVNERWNIQQQLVCINVVASTGVSLAHKF